MTRITQEHALLDPGSTYAKVLVACGEEVGSVAHPSRRKRSCIKLQVPEKCHHESGATDIKLCELMGMGAELIIMCTQCTRFLFHKYTSSSGSYT